MKKVGRALLNYLIKGLLVVVPISLSIFIVIWTVSTIDGWFDLNHILSVDSSLAASRNIPGLGLIIVLALIILAGVIVTYFVTEPMYIWFRRVMNRLPLINFIFTSIKDLTEAFVGEEKKFNNPVLVETEVGIKRIGFLTQSDLRKLGLPGEALVYFPFSYSFAGQVYVVNKEKITPLKMSASDAMKLVVSGGVSQI